MRTVIQRVKYAAVMIDGATCSTISDGLLLLLSIENEDSLDDIEWLTRKIANLRIFNDEAGVMNLSVLDAKGEILVVSQFTLHAMTKKGNRPSYIRASKPDIAIPLYELFCQKMTKQLGQEVKRGSFGANMQVESVNDGPVTIWIDTKNKE